MDGRREFFAQFVAPVQVVVDAVEMESILRVLSLYKGIEEVPPKPSYFLYLEHKWRRFICYELYKRLFDGLDSCEEQVTIELNHAEVLVLQEAISKAVEATGNHILSSLFGRIHQATCR